MQCNKRWGHDFTSNREVNYSNPRANSVKPNVNGRTHKLLAIHFFLCTQSFNSSKSWLSQLMHWEWRGMEVNFVFEQVINLGNHIFSYGERKHPEMCAHSIPYPCVSLPHAVGASYVFFSQFFLHFLHLSIAGNSFLYYLVAGK